MTETEKAKRESVAIGSLRLEGFQMPDGSYRMSLSSAAAAVGLQAWNTFDFLRSKAAECLLGSTSKLSVAEVEVELSPEQTTGQTRIMAISLEDQLRQNGIEPWQIGGGDRL